MRWWTILENILLYTKARCNLSWFGISASRCHSNVRQWTINCQDFFSQILTTSAVREKSFPSPHIRALGWSYRRLEITPPRFLSRTTHFLRQLSGWPTVTCIVGAPYQNQNTLHVPKRQTSMCMHTAIARQRPSCRAVSLSSAFGALATDSFAIYCGFRAPREPVRFV